MLNNCLLMEAGGITLSIPRRPKKPAPFIVEVKK
jgi:hypothetical protein